MLIESVKPSKDKCLITADGKEFNIAYETALSHKLSAGKNMDSSEFNAMLDESEELLCKAYLYKMVGKYLKTEKGYRDKLYQVGYHKKAVDKAIESAKNYGYINDERYVENYISSYKDKKGVHKLRMELKLKGVSSSVINKYLDSYETGGGAIDNLCNKFMKKREKNLDSKQKLFRHLISKGFSYEEVSKAVNKQFIDAE